MCDTIALDPNKNNEKWSGSVHKIFMRTGLLHSCAMRRYTQRQACGVQVITIPCITGGIHGWTFCRRERMSSRHAHRKTTRAMFTDTIVRLVAQKHGGELFHSRLLLEVVPL